jgi:ubiquinone/menaquinone biosynthesis C-methylase UbiE
VGFRYIRFLKERTLTGWKDKRKVIQRYDITAEMYDERYKEEQTRKYCKALQHIEITSAVVLDVGCGSGLFFDNVSDKAKIVIGIDVSRKLLNKAKEKANVSGNVYVLQADADHLPFYDKFFDRTFAFTILQNMPIPKKTLKELKRVSKTGGKIVVTGLKKAFPLNVFMDIIEESKLTVAAFVDDENVNCYVAVLTA